MKPVVCVLTTSCIVQLLCAIAGVCAWWVEAAVVERMGHMHGFKALMKKHLIFYLQLPHG
jgi:hypothetical protein